MLLGLNSAGGMDSFAEGQKVPCLYQSELGSDLMVRFGRFAVPKPALRFRFRGSSSVPYVSCKERDELWHSADLSV